MAPPTPLRTLVALCAALILAACSERQIVNGNGDIVAILGYDTVAYFTDGRPIKGSAEFEYGWQEFQWRFASAAHRDLFASDPEAYAPRYGGSCAGGMARGVVASVDPEAWAIVDGKLYLNYAKRNVAGFVDDAPNQISKADANWKMLGKRE